MLKPTFSGVGPYRGILMDKKCQRMPVVLTYLDNQTHNFSVLFADFFNEFVDGVPSWQWTNFGPGGLFVFQSKFVASIGVGNPISQSGKKCYYC